MVDEINIQSFLRLGYFIDFDEVWQPIDFSRIDTQAYADADTEDLIRLGIEKFRDSIDALFDANGDHVVPISGGFDSRLILGALLERTAAKNVQTYTFGVPGCYDFELGSQIAQVVGTRHHAFSFPHLNYHRDELLDVANRTGRQAVLFHHPPVWTLDRLLAGADIWSGYVGDAVVGSHLHDPPSATLDEAKRVHLRGRTFVRSTKLYRAEENEFVPRMGGGRQDPRQLSWDEQVLFDEAVAKFTAPLVLFKGFRYLTPLINSPWMDFMFSVPAKHRLGERLMLQIARRAYTTLFDLPSKNRLGHGFAASDRRVRLKFWTNRARKLAHQFFPAVNYPNHQYNDFNEALRSSPTARSLVQGCISDLRRRGVIDWIDVDSLWQRHDARVANHADALIVLASLELVLCARESREQPNRATGP